MTQPRTRPTRARPTTVIQAEPLLVDRDDAANALGLSVGTFESLVQREQAPKPRQISPGRVVWVWAELREFAASLPHSTARPGPGRKAA